MIHSPMEATSAPPQSYWDRRVCLTMTRRDLAALYAIGTHIGGDIGGPRGAISRLREAAKPVVQDKGSDLSVATVSITNDATKHDGLKFGPKWPTEMK